MKIEIRKILQGKRI